MFFRFSLAKLSLQHFKAIHMFDHILFEKDYIVAPHQYVSNCHLIIVDIGWSRI